MDQHDELKKIYYNPRDPGSFGSVSSLYARAKEKSLRVSPKDIKEFLSDQDAYTLHRPYRKRFQRNPIIVGCIDKQWQADLADMGELSKSNDGFRYLLTVIDCFSKYAWAIPLKQKSSGSLVQAFQALFKSSKPRIPERLQTDKGKEFLNKPVQELLSSKGIRHFCSESDQKAAIVERFNRTLKSKMWRFFTAQNTFRYMDVLDDLLHSYNNTFHRAIGMAPSQVTKTKELEIWKRLYPVSRKRRKNPMSLSEGNPVRISKVKKTFEKGYEPNWTQEIFKVKQAVVPSSMRRVYKISDWVGDQIEGKFYPEELQKVTRNPDKTFHIEKVLRKKVCGRQHFVLVKWKGLPDKFNSWVNQKDVERR